MKKALILLVLGLGGCGSASPQKLNNIDPAFINTYVDFINDASNHGINIDPDQGIIIQFHSTSDPTSSDPRVIGECDEDDEGHSIVDIDPTYWKSNDSNTHKVLIYHELSHCLLGEEHTKNEGDIMYPYIGLNVFSFEKNPTASLNKLFADSKRH